MLREEGIEAQHLMGAIEQRAAATSACDQGIMKNAAGVQVADGSG